MGVRPDTYRDAVREALDQRHIAYTGLEVREICLPDPHCIIIGDGTHTYAAVVVHGNIASAGQHHLLRPARRLLPGCSVAGHPARAAA